MRQQFLAEIENDIKGDIPKLIFADWLEEQGSPEAAGWRWIVQNKRFPKFVEGRGFIWSYYVNSMADENFFADSSWIQRPLWKHHAANSGVRPGWFVSAIDAFCELAIVYGERLHLFGD